jgi:plastocyanin
MPGGGVGMTNPGETNSVVQNLEPGTWIAVNDSGEGDESPWTEFEVTEGEAGEPPAAAATITATDFAFESSGLKAGENDVTFANDGEQWHHVVAAPLAEDATAEDLKEFFASEEPPEGPPPGLDEEGSASSAVLGGGQSQNLKLNLEKPGKYALLCFISNKEGGPPHVAYGMVSEVEVE